MAKYGNQRDGWETKDNMYRFSLMWKNILSVKEKFMQNIKYQVRSGENILFWKDIWIGDCLLAKKFPELFKCGLVKDTKVKTYFGKGTNKEVIWCRIFRRNLTDIEERQFLALLNLLRDVLIPEEGGGCQDLESLERWFIFRIIIPLGHFHKDSEDIPDKEYLEVQGPTKNCGLLLASSPKTDSFNG